MKVRSILFVVFFLFAAYQVSLERDILEGNMNSPLMKIGMIYGVLIAMVMELSGRIIDRFFPAEK